MRNATRIFYNRVPKCGSSFTIEALKLAQKRYDRFHQIHSKIFIKHERINEQKTFEFMTSIDELDSKGKPWVFDRHLHFIDFTKYNRVNPLYINIVRKPIDRFLSYYYFIRQADFIYKMETPRRNMTFEECVYSNDSECSTEGAFQDGSIPYFCGQAEICTKPTREAVALAKKNVNRYFGVVALNEDLLNGLALCEQTTPDVFRGLTNIAASMINKKINKASTTHKRPPEAVRIMEERLALENEFYAFVKQRYLLFKEHFQTERFVQENVRLIKQATQTVPPSTAI